MVNRTGLSAEITWTGVDDAPGVSGGSRNLAVSNNSDANIASITPDDGTTAQAGFLNTDGKVVRVLYTMNEDSQGFDCSISGYLIG
jgi:hypothetical protein